MPIQVHTTPVWDDKYSFTRDLLWKKTLSSQGFDDIWFYHYNRHRYYSPYVGRFISKDPIGLLGGYNVYAYAPNPVEWVDPRGLLVKKHCEFDRQNNPCTKQNPSKYARGWQGKGNYKGKDSYKNVVVRKGTVLYALWPNGRDTDPKKNFSNCLVDSKELKTLQRKCGATAFNDALQIRHGGNTDGAWAMRTKVIKFIVRKDTCMAIGQAQKNGRYGIGGGTQYVIDEKDYGNITNTGQITDI